MSEKEEEAFKPVQLEQQDTETPQPEPTPPPYSSIVDTAGAQGPNIGEQAPNPDSTPAGQGGRWSTSLEQFKLRRFFVLRPGTLESAIEDIKTLVNMKEDGAVQSFWLMAEIDHWNNEKERMVVITDNTLLICKYDFIMLKCEQIQRIPLNLVDRVIHGSFTFPQRSLLTREGEGVRVYWDRQREPSFTSRWNPFSVDFPFTTLSYHPVRNVNEKLARMCEIHAFREGLTAAAQKAHTRNPVPGKANGVLVLNQPILIEAYVGVMSVLGNQNKLGYCLARGNVGF